MSMVLTIYGRALFNPALNLHHNLKYNDFTIVRDGEEHQRIFWLDRKAHVARFKGRFIDADRELKLMLITNRLST